MSDKVKTILAILFLLGSLIFPLFGLFIGWWQWDVTTGLILMAGIFLFLSIIGFLMLLRVKDLSWITVYMPYIFGSVYGFLPDAIPLSIDDAATTTAGAIFSFVLALRKQADTPKWIFIPLVAAGIYALVGGWIPGPVDEFIVDSLALVLAWIGTRKGTN